MNNEHHGILKQSFHYGSLNVFVLPRKWIIHWSWMFMIFVQKIFVINWKVLARYFFCVLTSFNLLRCWSCSCNISWNCQILRDEEGKKLGLGAAQKSVSKENDVKMSDSEVCITCVYACILVRTSECIKSFSISGRY